ncbi:MAG: glycerate kinase, partial [Planctomycetota bacterium]
MLGVPGPESRGAAWRCVVAVDKFKDALPAAEACRAVARGVRQVLPEAEVDLCPMADG